MKHADGTPVDTVHLLRTMQQHHVSLSQMADQKANILIGATTVVFALVVREGHESGMSIPLLILAVMSFTAAALCVLAVIPSTGGKSRRPPANPNYLFFGAFADLSEAEFEVEMYKILGDNGSIHRAMIRDVHQLGSVLKHKKYKFLAYGYRVFIAGLALTLAAFLVQTLVAQFHPSAGKPALSAIPCGSGGGALGKPDPRCPKAS